MQKKKPSIILYSNVLLTNFKDLEYWNFSDYSTLVLGYSTLSLYTNFNIIL